LFGIFAADPIFLLARAWAGSVVFSFIILHDMKPILFACFFFFAAAVAAQSTNTEARAATEALAAKYSLTEAQTAAMLRIQERKQRDLAKVAALKGSDPALYLDKMESLQNGTLGSIRRVLTSEAQQALFQQTQTTVRTRRAEKQKELRAQGADQAAIREAMLALYAE
jgi:hypothetical protein